MIDKQSYNLHDIAERLGIKKHRSGRYHCFQGDRHKNGDQDPSLSIQNQYFNCFGCGVKGDLFTLIQECTGTDFKGACSWLGGNNNTYFKPLMTPLLRPKPSTSDYCHYMGTIWKAVKDKPFSAATVQYLKRRGLAPELAYFLGFRDFSIDDLPPADPMHLTDLGLKRGTRLCPSIHCRGLKIPVYGRTQEHPVAWRTRPLGGNGPKEIAPFGVGLANIPLGYRNPSSYLLVICEGTPDYLSFEQVSRELGENFDVWGVTAISAKWDMHLHATLGKYSEVIYAGHNTAASEALAESIKETIEYYDFPTTYASSLLKEEEDANDLLQKGLFHQWVKALIERDYHG